jgi:tetratricopeptide (TPR) repeat protein
MTSHTVSFVFTVTRFLTSIFALMLLFCCTGPTEEVRPDFTRSLATTKQPEIKLYAFEDKDIMTASNKQRKADAKQYSHWIAKIGEWNEAIRNSQTFSEKYHQEIIRSRELYSEGNYVEAVNLLTLIVKEEPYNLFALNDLARTLYRINDRKSSLDVYNRLIGIMDNQGNDAGGGVVVPIDAWFPEAYWKYGTLLMDHGYWDLAAYNISRFLMYESMVRTGQPVLLFEQALSYLTEAFFNMKKYDIAKYYAQETLKLNPDNGYVKKYLDQME